ncbi:MULTISPECIES: hypothetical protein [unclassified Wolbachia]|uniref:hypothetical protein n=1 Tax=unclassified Wolbachia TaxID=2640676 RepID=UPI00222FC779|nr:hypothetical protein [Wolbachia endosymbiont (group A) of Apoderus coryli]
MSIIILRAISMGRHTQLYERCSLGHQWASAQTLGSSLSIIIKTLCFNIKQLFLCLPT